MLKYILIIPAVLALIFLTVVAVQSPEFRVQRSAVVNAPVATVFAQVNDLHHWELWSPWAKLDPQMKTTYEGEPSGIGAVYTWSGNNNVGEGRTTITGSISNELVQMRLDFLRPFAGTNNVAFTFEPAGEQTKVTWTMTGQKNFIAKAMGLFMDCEKMCGGQFEKGLSNLKEVTEVKVAAK